MATVLFVCLCNAGRSQMSAALFEQAARGRHRAMSAGTLANPNAHVHPEVITAMQEVGIDLSQRRPVRLTDELAAQADLVVTMGCGDRCPYIPGTRYIDWNLDDPSGKPLEDVRAIRDDIAHRVEQLVDDLGSSTTDHQTSRGSCMTRIGINGFGRMGRLALRAAWGQAGISFAHVNELHGDAATAAHLLTFDSVHGRWDRGIHGDATQLTVDGTRLSFTGEAQPGDVAWEDQGIDVVLECSGRFRTPELLAPYFERGVRKVIVAAPVKDPRALNVVVGVNDHRYDPDVHDIITAASCTTNCLAPVVKVIHEGLGIERGSITTLHDLTNTQTIVDAPHKDLRRARAAGMSLIPTTTGSATAIGLIFPELQGRLDGLAIRVPLLNASLTDCVFEVARPTTVEEVNGLLHAAADGPLAGILGYEERPLVSIDYKDDPRSGIVDALSTMVTGERQVKILAWYDNEWGYANRLVDLARRVARSLS